jgi:Xaa-Pro dipeptidase
MVSNREIDRRVEAIRNKMSDEGLDILIVFSQVILGEKGAVRYISDYRLLTRKDYLVLPLSGDPMMIVPTLGQQISALHVSWIKDIRFSSEAAGMIGEVAQKVKSVCRDDARVGIVGLNGIPYQDFELLKKELPRTYFTDASKLLNDIRAVKSSEEIEKIKATTEIADDCYKMLLGILHSGSDELEFMAEVNKLLTLKGVEDTLILTSKGRSFPCFIAPPGPYIFKDGDHYVFSIEISGPGGYWSQIVRPICLGAPSPVYEQLFKTGKQAIEAGVSGLLPGRQIGEIARIISSEAKNAGFKTGVWSGHGMGMDLGDGIGIFEDSTLELKDGMIITIHPHIMTRDGKEGLLLGDTYLVRENGAQNLSRTQYEFKCIP